MYYEYFKIKEEPFSTTPDPRFLYRSSRHQEALERLNAAVTMRRGVTALVGEPGLGKSTIIRTMLQDLKNSVRFAWLFNTTLNSTELLKYICRDFGLEPQGSDKGQVLMELYTFLIEKYKKGYNCVLVIDEAQNLSPEVLEEIRLLSNLETVNNKLLQIVLSGQPELDEHLNAPELLQLKQRISLKSTLVRLNREETHKYILHRLNMAGAPVFNIFNKSALHAVHQLSDGIPRMINHVCENAMMLAAKQKLEKIDAGLVKETARLGLISPVESRSVMLKTDTKQENEKSQVNGIIRTIENEPESDKFGFIDINELITVL